jgi:hypothetical protein
MALVLPQSQTFGNLSVGIIDDTELKVRNGVVINGKFYENQYIFLQMLLTLLCHMPVFP